MSVGVFPDILDFRRERERERLLQCGHAILNSLLEGSRAGIQMFLSLVVLFDTWRETQYHKKAFGILNNKNQKSTIDCRLFFVKDVLFRNMVFIQESSWIVGI